MTDLIIQGINGRMGHTLVEKISARSDCRIVAGVDQKAGKIGDIPVYASLEDLPEAKGIVIDFTSPAGTVHAAQFCAAHGMPCVLCSTGLSKEDEAVVEQASEKVPVFRSANMSLGINVLLELVKKAAATGRDLILECWDVECAKAALAVAGKNVILDGATPENYEAMNAVAKEAGVVLGVHADNLSDLYDTVKKLEAAGNKNLVLDVTGLCHEVLVS